MEFEGGVVQFRKSDTKISEIVLAAGGLLWYHIPVRGEIFLCRGFFLKTKKRYCKITAFELYLYM